MSGLVGEGMHGLLAEDEIGVVVAMVYNPLEGMMKQVFLKVLY